MFSKYDLIILLILAVGAFYSIFANEDNIDTYFGCNNENVFFAQNNLGNPPPPMDDQMREFGDPPPNNSDFDRRRNDKRREGSKITPELERRLTAALKKHFPEFYSRAVDLRKNNPKVYKKLLRKLRRHIRKSREPKEEKIDLISMIFDESEVDILVSKYKNSNSVNEKAKLKLIIKEKMSEGFDKREEIQKKVIERIEDNIKKKKTKHLERVKNKNKLIEEQLNKILK